MSEEEYTRKPTRTAAKKDRATKERAPHCYLCKRRRGEGTVLVLIGSNETMVRPLKVGEVSVKLGELQATFYLCYECFILLSKVAPILGQTMEGEDWKT